MFFVFPHSHVSIWQKTEFIQSIEKLTFWAGDNQKLHFAKQELLSQIQNLEISINVKGFFTVNRQLMAEVSVRFSFECSSCLNSLLIFVLCLCVCVCIDRDLLLHLLHHIYSILFDCRIKVWMQLGYDGRWYVDQNAANHLNRINLFISIEVCVFEC